MIKQKDAPPRKIIGTMKKYFTDNINTIIDGDRYIGMEKPAQCGEGIWMA